MGALAGVSTPLPVIAFCQAFWTPAVTAEDLAARRGTADEPLVVDVRPTAEYNTGHVADAISIPHTKRHKRVDEARQAKNGVVLGCSFDTRTRLAGQTLLDHDVPHVFRPEGGLGAGRQGVHEIRTGWGP